MSRHAVLFLAASLGGRILFAQSVMSQQMVAAQEFAAQAGLGGASQNGASQKGAWQTPYEVPLAEDSPATRADNMLFYNSPRGAQLVPRPAPAGTVSMEQLQHPLSRKGAKLLDQAKNYELMGRHDKAIAQLQAALKEKSAEPYAHSMLGAEYVRTGQPAAAVAELEQALTVLPKNVPTRSNLGYALFLTGNLDRAEQETRQALELDHRNATTLHVLDQILRAKASSQELPH